MTNTSDINWKRVIAEGVAIVASILLAFAIDAWWQNRNEAASEQRLLQALLAEFEHNNDVLIEAGEQYRQRHEDASKLLAYANVDWSEVDQTDYGDRVRGLLSNRTFHLESGAHDGLLASGELSLIRDDVLRNHLAAWPSHVAEWTEEEAFVFTFVAKELTPHLATLVRLQDISGSLPAFTHGEALVQVPVGDSDANALRVLHESRDFENLVFRRLQGTWHALRDGETLKAQLAMILDLIRQSLNE